MLLQLENTNKENVSKLIDFAGKMNLHLSVVDETSDNISLPGKPLTDLQLKNMIESSRNSGIISMQDAHRTLNENGTLNWD